eukprot:2518524-Rhodomonas_salina.1
MLSLLALWLMLTLSSPPRGLFRVCCLFSRVCTLVYMTWSHCGPTAQCHCNLKTVAVDTITGISTASGA